MDGRAAHQLICATCIGDQFRHVGEEKNNLVAHRCWKLTLTRRQQVTIFQRTITGVTHRFLTDHVDKEYDKS